MLYQIKWILLSLDNFSNSTAVITLWYELKNFY